MALKSLWKSSGKNRSTDESQKLFVESLRHLQEFRLNGTLTDLNLTVDGAAFKAHRLVLACHSKVFEAMLTNEMLEARRGEVQIKDVSSHIFSLFLNYLYTGAVPTNLQQEDAVDLFVCADKYHVESLVVLCENVMGERLDPKNVVKIFIFAESYKRPFLRKRTAGYIRLYIKDVIESDDWSLISSNSRLLRKLILWSSKKVIGSLLVDSFKYKLRSPCTCLYRSTLGKQSLEWAVESEMRPVELKLFGSRPPTRGMTKFCVVFDWFKKTPHSPQLIVQLYPHSRLKSAQLTAFCRMALWTENKNEKLSEKESLLIWRSDLAHPTMGNRRVEVFRSNIPPNGTVLTCDVEVHSEQIDKPNLKFSESYEAAPTVVQPWVVKVSEATPLPTLSSRTVVLNFGEVRFNVDEQVLKWFSALYSDAIPSLSRAEELNIPNISETSARAIVNYLNSGVLPSRDEVTLELLRGAWELQLSELIIYVEHALVYDFDPTVAIDALLEGDALGLGFLKWGALQYLKANLHRVIRWELNWTRIGAHLLEQLLFEQNREWSPCLLPPYLIYHKTHVVTVGGF